jgi:hypothetical protein
MAKLRPLNILRISLRVNGEPNPAARIALAGLRLVILAVGTGLCEDIIKIGAISSFYIPFYTNFWLLL